MSGKLTYILKAATALPVTFTTVFLFWLKQHGHLAGVPWFVLPAPMLGLAHYFRVTKLGKLSAGDEALLSSKIALSEGDNLRRIQLTGGGLAALGILMAFMTLKSAFELTAAALVLIFVGWAVNLSADVKRRAIVGRF